jgi:hypothetical protein
MLGTALASIGATGGITGSCIHIFSPIICGRTVGHNEAMAPAEDQARHDDQPPSRPAYFSSVVALALGIVLAIGVSSMFGLLGWGGELA